MKRLFWVIAAAGSLTACGGGDSAAAAVFRCEALTGNTSSPCTTCSDVENRQAMADGDISSAAGYVTYRSNNLPNNGQVTFIVDRAAGAAAMPAGTTPGFAIQLPVATGLSYTLTPSLRFNGAVVQAGDPTTISGNTNAEFRYIGIQALTAFDGLQVNLQYSEPVGATESTHELLVYEACANGGLQP